MGIKPEDRNNKLLEKNVNVYLEKHASYGYYLQ